MILSTLEKKIHMTLVIEELPLQGHEVSQRAWCVFSSWPITLLSSAVNTLCDYITTALTYSCRAECKLLILTT